MIEKGVIISNDLNFICSLLLGSTQSFLNLKPKRIYLTQFHYQNYNACMTSPKKSLEVQKDTTLFGQLSHIQKQTNRMSHQLLQDIQNIKRLQTDFSGIQREAKFAAQDSKVKLSLQIHAFQEKIKNYMITQKAEYTRVASQINQIVTTHKDLNAQLTVLNNRFQEFQKNVGL